MPTDFETKIELRTDEMFMAVDPCCQLHLVVLPDR